MSDPSPVLHRIQTLLAETLGLPDGGRSLRPDTQLFGAIPELDSLAVLDLLAGLEAEFGITIDDQDFGSDIFDTVGTLVEFVDRSLVATAS
ncbi:MAG TPA: acyl carrier protein [Microlunatus sp.]|nr:acyl carrier protein [Microlunatus sp.]